MPDKSKLKIHSLFSIGKEEPSWSTDKYDFYAIEEDGFYVIAQAIEKANRNNRIFLLYRNGQPIYDSPSLESIGIRKTMEKKLDQED